MNTRLIPFAEFERVREAALDDRERLAIVAAMCRLNTLSIVKRAGSGHLGSSFSAMDIVVWLYYRGLNTLATGFDDPSRDVYFSSKGHDVPGLYAVLFSLGAIPAEKLLALRRHGGLDGHPDVGVRGIEASSGSLGMGISKGKGIAWARRHRGVGGHVFVMTGDGELQEGQNFEALQNTAQLGLTNLTIVVDHNKVQSDRRVTEIVDLGDLDRKIAAFGWRVERIDGHDYTALARALTACRASDRPTAIVADTIKGAGVSFMEHPTALSKGNGLYPWHAGAPDETSFTAAFGELHAAIDAKLRTAGLDPVTFDDVPPEGSRSATPVSLAGEPISAAASLAGEPVSQAARAAPQTSKDEYVADAFGEALYDIGARTPHLVVLDADLSADCRLRRFERAFPDRFIEIGIAEQDMVSTAGGLARHGLLPVVNSFASFLASRANEQIYNNACEQSRIIYVNHYGGLIPAGPGKSHQSIRDISLLAALPNMTILEPCNARETRLLLEYCVDRATENCALRLAIGPSPRRLALPDDYAAVPGRGVALTTGADLLVFAYGPVLLHEALAAAERLAAGGAGVTVVNMPWLNRVDAAWLRDLVGPFRRVYAIDDHSPHGGLGDTILNALSESGLLDGRTFRKIGVEGFPACGTPPQALRAHGLDGESLARRLAAEGHEPLVASPSIRG